MLPPVAPRITRERMPAKATRQEMLETSLMAQVTALMMNAQRYEMRAGVERSLGEDDTESRQASDHFASSAFSVINKVLGDLPSLEQELPKSREEALSREIPDADELRKARDPEVPDATESSEADNIVGPDGLLISKTGEQDV